MNMKKRLGLLIILMMLTQLLLIPAFTADAKADTRVMITQVGLLVVHTSFYILYFGLR